MDVAVSFVAEVLAEGVVDEVAVAVVAAAGMGDQWYSRQQY